MKPSEVPASLGFMACVSSRRFDSYLLMQSAYAMRSSDEPVPL